MATSIESAPWLLIRRIRRTVMAGMGPFKRGLRESFDTVCTPGREGSSKWVIVSEPKY
jgi:hypothetical protein